jgi:hypothetical protein
MDVQMLRFGANSSSIPTKLMEVICSEKNIPHRVFQQNREHELLPSHSPETQIRQFSAKASSIQMEQV